MKNIIHFVKFVTVVFLIEIVFSFLYGRIVNINHHILRPALIATAIITIIYYLIRFRMTDKFKQSDILDDSEDMRNKPDYDR